jgi:hypothetical protein
MLGPVVDIRQLWGEVPPDPAFQPAHKGREALFLHLSCMEPSWYAASEIDPTPWWCGTCNVRTDRWRPLYVKGSLED